MRCGMDFDRRCGSVESDFVVLDFCLVDFFLDFYGGNCPPASYIIILTACIPSDATSLYVGVHNDPQTK